MASSCRENASCGDSVPLSVHGSAPLGADFRLFGQCGTNTVVVVDIVTISVDLTIVINISSVIRILTGRPEPPPRAYVLNRNPYRLTP